MSYDPEDDCVCICHEDEDEEDAEAIWVGKIPESNYDYVSYGFLGHYMVEEDAAYRFDNAVDVTPKIAHLPNAKDALYNNSIPQRLWLPALKVDTADNTEQKGEP